MDTLLIFFFNRIFLDTVEKKNPFFFKFKESLSFLYNGTQNFKFIDHLYATPIGWILYTFQDTSTRLI